ncbi:hypothetical protein [Longimicrobium sp.]|uniref:hypothetical protein n=1 Tax=Longimicrobium sp. TaxID=2029185 RepID=UPI002B95C295|nr:hypothetical protein [Longimicrobium sp.]HSU15438.1 hypothetical protein [Longimicrobium sp.]
MSRGPRGVPAPVAPRTARSPSQLLANAALIAGAAALSAFFFAAFFAPGWPRTVWGWAIAAALGLPLLVLGEVILVLCLAIGPPRFNLVRRVFPAGERVFRYRAGSRTGQAVMLAVRVIAAAALIGGGLWGLHLLLHISIIRAQFR